MPVNIGDTLQEVMARLLAFKQEVDPNSDDNDKANELRKRLETLIKEVQVFQQVLAQVPRLGSKNDRADALRKIEQLIVVDEGVSLDVFFKQVGNAVISAQSALDGKAIADLRSRRLGDPIPPVQYAIPSVRAEMKVGFSQVSSRGVNVVVFQNATQKQRYSESTVSFDIVAAPVPPNQAALPPPSAEPPPGVPQFGVPPPEEEGGTGISFGIGAAEPEIVASPEPPLDFPLTREARAAALDRLAALFSASEAKHLARVRDKAAVVPSRSALGGPVRLVYFCPGVVKPKASRTARAFRCYLAEYEPPSRVALQPLRRPDSVDVLAAHAGALVVPRAPTARRDPAALARIVGGVGTVLMHVVLGARAWRPPLMVDEQRDAALVRRLRRRFRNTPLALGDDDPWVIFRDGEPADELHEYLVLRPTVVPGSEEWQEFHIASVSDVSRKLSVAPHLHLPPAATVEQWARDSPGNLVLLVKDCERLLRRLTAMLVHAAG